MSDLLHLVKTYSDKFDAALESANAIRDAVAQQRDEFRSAFEDLSEHAFLADADPALLKEFLDKPYVLLPVSHGANGEPNKYWLVIPRFLKFSGGWAVRTIGAFNVFEFTRFINFISPPPEWLASQLDFQKAKWAGVFDGNDLVISEGNVKEIARKFGNAVRSVSGERIHLKPASRFDIIRKIIREDGILPFAPSPIPEELRRDRSQHVVRDEDGVPMFSLRGYQQRAYDKLLEFGRESLFWYGQTGKSFVALEGLAGLQGPKLILCPTRTLREQWLNVRLPLLKESAQQEVTVDTYHNIHKYRETQWSLIVLDEAHHLPANLFIEGALLKTHAVLGLSATPVREDGNEDMIPALCGFPNADFEMTATQKPSVSVWLVKDMDAKLKLAAQLVEKPIKGKTFVFTWKLDIGNLAAEKLGVPFIHGGTKKPLQVITDHDVVVISKVGDAGLSFPVDRIVEVDFQFGSRQEAGQRLLRAANDTGRQSEFHTLMTPHEFQNYGKRLLIYEQWGLEISYHDLTGKLDSGFAPRSPNGHGSTRPPRQIASPIPLGGAQRRVPSSRAATPKVKAPVEPKTEAERMMQLPAIQSKFAKATETLYPLAARYLPRLFQMCYEQDLTIQDIADALRIKSRSPINSMRLAARKMVEVGLLKEKEARFQVNKAEVERARMLARLVPK